MPLTDIDACKKGLERFGKRRLYWFKSGTYASLSDVWLTSPDSPELRKLIGDVRNYLDSNIFVSFFQWLFTDINRRVGLLAYYVCCKAVKVYESNNRTQANAFPRWMKETWVLPALGESSIFKEGSHDLLGLVCDLQDDFRSNPLPSVTLPEAGRFYASLKSQPAQINDSYSYLGPEVNANTDIAGLKKAFRMQVLIKHPDKGGDVEEFQKLQAAYVLAIYKRTLPPYNEDAQGLLAQEDLGKLKERLQAESLGLESVSVNNMAIFFAASIRQMRVEAEERQRKDRQVLTERWKAVRESVAEVFGLDAQKHKILDANEPTMSELNEIKDELLNILVKVMEEGDVEKIQKIQTVIAGLLDILIKMEQIKCNEAVLAVNSKDNDGSISSPKIR